MVYQAFLSYNREADSELAKTIQSRLHSIARPWYRLRSMRVFRDQTGFGASPALWTSTENTLRQSSFLLLLASPSAAQSYWVKREIQWWLDNRSTKQIIILVSGGDVHWDKTAEDFDWGRTSALPELLQGRFKEEPVYVDLRWTKGKKLSSKDPDFRSAVLDIAAPLLGKTKDELDGEDVRRLRANRRWASLAALVSVSAAASAGFWFFSASGSGKQAKSRSLANQADLIREQQSNLLPQSTLIAVKSIKTAPTLAADQSAYLSTSLLGPLPSAKRTYTGLKNLVLSPHARYIGQVPFEGPVIIEEAESGLEIASLINIAFGEPTTHVSDIAFSEDESRIVTLGAVGLSAFVWELPHGKEVFRTPTNRAGISAVALSADGRYLATGHIKGITVLWNLSTGEETLRIPHEQPVRRIRFSRNMKYLAINGSIGTPDLPDKVNALEGTLLRLWDIDLNREVALLDHDAALTSVSFSPDESHLVTLSGGGLEDSVVRIWNLETGEQARTIANKKITTIGFTSKGVHLLSGDSNGSSQLWSVQTGEELTAIDHESPVGSAKVLGVDNVPFIATAGGDGVIRIWIASNPTREYLRLPMSPNTLQLGWSKSGRYWVTIGHDLQADVQMEPIETQKEIRVWTEEDLRKELPLFHERLADRIVFSQNGLHMATSDYEAPEIRATGMGSAAQIGTGSGSASIWKIETKKRVAHHQHPGAVTSLHYHPDGEHLATACTDGKARIFAGTEEAAKITLKHHEDVYFLRFSHDGTYLATASGKLDVTDGEMGPGLMTLWRWSTGEKVTTLKSTKPILNLAFSNDDQYLAIADFGGTVNTLFLSEMQAGPKVELKKPIFAMAIAPEGRFVAAAGGSLDIGQFGQVGFTSIWDIHSSRETTLQLHSTPAIQVAFSPDGELLASIDQEGIIRIWRTEDHRELQSIKLGLTTLEASLQFSANNEYLLTGGGNRAQVWEVATGTELSRREHTLGLVKAAVFSLDEKYIATSGTDTIVNLWLWRPEDLISDACRKLPEDFDWGSIPIDEEVSFQSVCG